MPNAMVSFLLGSQLMSAVQFSEQNLDGTRKVYEQTSTQPQRDRPVQALYTRRYAEPANRPYLRSGHTGLDALFALAMTEAQENSVATIRDGAFQNGQPLPCSCFETGELWHYVWTRDSAYAVDLGLAWLDPQRSRETLLFKLSKARQPSRFGAGVEIVQDTGTGGSWPISTDRVVWGLGADRLLDLLPPPDQPGFRAQAYEALKNTVETDRLVIFDREHGLYRGEQSFLDWREQTYPSWTREDVKAVGQSFALSTNVLHLLALRQASRYAATLGDPSRHERYHAWAVALAQNIRSLFWMPELGMLASMSNAADLAIPLAKFDLLGLALAVQAGLVTPDEGRRMFSQYPLHKAGPPVIHPQLPATPIYHNRAVWPFVTAYGIKAAARVGHAPFVTASMQSLWNGAALNLSHMENLEFLSGLPYVADGSNSGPVVNSRRQLWSVAAFVSMVVDSMLGLEVKDNELRIQPHLTQTIARQWMSGGRLTLHDLTWGDKRLAITMQWPAMSGSRDGFFKVAGLRLNGETVAGSTLASSQLLASNQILIDLIPESESAPLPLNMPQVGVGPALSHEEYKQVFAPMDPRLSWLDGNTIRIDRRDMNPTLWDLYRNGRRIASNIRGATWTVPGAGCYMAIQTYENGSLASHPSPELCRLEWAQEFSAPAQLMSLDGASQSWDHGRPHFNDWGRPDQVLELADLRVPRDGAYRAEVAFGNAFGPINTGITAAVKWLEVTDIGTGDMQSAAVFMPHQVSWGTWSWSSAAALQLQAGRGYRLRLADARNMSYLQHFERYTAGLGGAGGIVNRANISGIRLRLNE